MGPRGTDGDRDTKRGLSCDAPMGPARGWRDQGEHVRRAAMGGACDPMPCEAPTSDNVHDVSSKTPFSWASRPIGACGWGRTTTGWGRPVRSEARAAQRADSSRLDASDRNRHALRAHVA